MGAGGSFFWNFFLLSYLIVDINNSTDIFSMWNDKELCLEFVYAVHSHIKKYWGQTEELILSPRITQISYEEEKFNLIS